MNRIFFAFAILSLSTTAFGSTCLERFPSDIRKADECKRAERREEIRKIATHRLVAISQVTADLVKSAYDQGLDIAVNNNDREAAWCEGFLNDFLRLEQIAIVDDERVIGPKWEVVGSDFKNRKSTEILDPYFIETKFAGKPVIKGYVTVRWKQDQIVLVRPHVSCAFQNNQAVGCNRQFYLSINVYSSNLSDSCEAMPSSKEYRRTTNPPSTPIQLRLPGSKS